MFTQKRGRSYLISNSIAKNAYPSPPPNFFFFFGGGEDKSPPALPPQSNHNNGRLFIYTIQVNSLFIMKGEETLH